VCVGLDVAGEPLEEIPGGEAVVLGGVVEEDVIAIGEGDEEVSLATGLVLAVVEGCGLDRDAGGVGGEAEGGGERLFALGLDDAAESGADVLGVAAHGGAIEGSALEVELLIEAVEGHAHAVLLGEDVGDHGRGEQTASDELFGQARGHDAHGGREPPRTRATGLRADRRRQVCRHVDEERKRAGGGRRRDADAPHDVPRARAVTRRRRRGSAGGLGDGAPELDAEDASALAGEPEGALVAEDLLALLLRIDELEDLERQRGLGEIASADRRRLAARAPVDLVVT